MEGYYISISTLRELLKNKPVRRLLLALLDNSICGIVYDVTVTKYTKLLRYKNKSTVSRALTKLKKDGLIRPGLFKNNYYINKTKIPYPL